MQWTGKTGEEQLTLREVLAGNWNGEGFEEGFEGFAPAGEEGAEEGDEGESGPPAGQPGAEKVG